MAQLVFYFVVLVAAAVAIPLDPYNFDQYPSEDQLYDSDILEEIVRSRRSLQPGAPNVQIPGQQQEPDGWSLNPTVGRNDQGNTNANIDLKHKGKDHDFHAQWEKVVRGPGKAKPTWSVGGTYRW